MLAYGFYLASLFAMLAAIVVLEMPRNRHLEQEARRHEHERNWQTSDTLDSIAEYQADPDPRPVRRAHPRPPEREWDHAA